MNNAMVKLADLYEHVSEETGNTYLAGRVNAGTNVLVLKIADKEKEGAPDWELYLEPAEDPRKAPAPPTSYDFFAEMPPVFTVRTLADFLGCERKTVERMLERGELDYHQRSGMSIRILKPQVIAWLDETRISPASNTPSQDARERESSQRASRRMEAKNRVRMRKAAALTSPPNKKPSET